MNDNAPARPPLTHVVSFTPIERDKDGREIAGTPREIGAIGVRPDSSGFRFVCRRSTDFNPEIGGLLSLRKLDEPHGRDTDRNRERD